MPSAAGIPDRSPNADVLAACVYASTSTQLEGRLRAALARVEDWEALSAVAMHHGMAAVLYRRVSSLCPDAVPPSVLGAWRDHSLGVARRSLRMQQALVLVMDGLSSAGLPALAFKGPVISQQLYGDAALRLFSDIDVLVSRDSVRSAREVAHSLGYEDAHSIWLTAGELPEDQDGEREIELQHPRTHVPLEIHWRTGPRFAENSLQAPGLLAHAEEIELLGRPIACLDALDTILVLVVHAAAHEWQRIEDAVALAAALAQIVNERLRDLEARARANRCSRRLYVGVLTVAALAPASMSTELEGNARADRLAAWLAKAASRRLRLAIGAGVYEHQPTRRDRIWSAWWEALTLDSLGESARYIWRRLFMTTAYDLPDSGVHEQGARGALSTQLRRQRRLWQRGRR